MIYKIKPGKHYSNNWFNFPFISFDKKIEGKFTFLDSKGDTTLFTNKLCGLSDNFHHHKDSIRIGWRWQGGMIQLMSIHYKNGTPERFPLRYISPMEEIAFRIQIFKDRYEIQLDEDIFTFDRSSKYFLPSLILKPYYGGDKKSPNLQKIKIKWEKNYQI